MVDVMIFKLKFLIFFIGFFLCHQRCKPPFFHLYKTNRPKGRGDLHSQRVFTMQLLAHGHLVNVCPARTIPLQANIRW